MHLRGDLGARQRYNLGEGRFYSGHFLFPADQAVGGIGAKLLQLAAEMLGCEYGFLFLRDAFCLPEGYCTGYGPAFVPHTEATDADNREIREWSLLKADWSENRPDHLSMRDVYNVNLLSELIFQQQATPGVSLKDWILRDSGRGQLFEAGPNRFIWQLTDREIENVRPALQEAGISKSRIPHTYRDVFSSALLS